MNRRFLTGILISGCLCLIVNISYAWDEPPIVFPPIPGPGPEPVCVGDTIFFQDGGSYDPDGGDIDSYGWWIWDYGDSSYTHGQSGSSQTYSFDSGDWGPGVYGVDLWVTDDEGNESDTYGSTLVWAIKVTIQDDPPNRDTSEHIHNDPQGDVVSFLAHIYYKIEPIYAWSPTSVWLFIKDGVDVIWCEPLPLEVGEQSTTWDGKTHGGFWAEPGEYTMEIEVSAGPIPITCSDTHPITVVRVKIAGTRNILEYYADDGHPTIPFTVSGEPPGGTFEWLLFTASGEEGAATILNDPTAATVQVRATAPSSDPEDVRLLACYYYDGFEAFAQRWLTILTPKLTNFIKGELHAQGGATQWVTRNYYHEVFDQFGQLVFDLPGLPSDEVLVHKEGNPCAEPRAGDTMYCEPDSGGDGQWQGGVAIKDELECWSYWFSVCEQTLTVAGGTTSPKYDIVLKPADLDMGRIWKNSK
jgi:hypothetical protein